MKIKDISDLDLVLAVLERPSKLSRSEVSAFEGMAKSCQAGTPLSEKQRAWVQERFRALGLMELFDGKKYDGMTNVAGSEIGAYRLETMLGPKVMAPPVSRRNWA